MAMEVGDNGGRLLHLKMFNVCAFLGTQRMFRRISAPHHGLIVDMVDISNAEKVCAALTAETRLVWFETPTNPLSRFTNKQNTRRREVLQQPFFCLQ